MKKLKWFFLILFVSSVLLGINLFVRLNNYAATVNYSREHNLPIMRITLNGVTLEEIENHSKDIKYEGNYLELTEKGMTTSFSEVEIKGRGSLIIRLICSGLVLGRNIFCLLIISIILRLGTR